MNKKTAAVLGFVLVAGCSSSPTDGESVPPMAPSRLVSEQDCSRPLNTKGGNLLCREVSDAERRARLEEEERQARAKREAAERAERERLERERAEQLAREEAARKARLAEEERLAAERRRAEAAAAAAAAAERERLAKLEAERLARERAAQEAREAAIRECSRLEQERLEGRAVLEGFVANYGKADEFKDIAGQISAWLARPRKPKPCPSA